jgi:hypothetical protein
MWLSHQTSQVPRPGYTRPHCNVLGGYIQPHHNVGTWTGVEDRVKAAQVQYCRARTAVMNLRGPGNWENTLQVLNPSDVRALNERELTEQEKDEERRVRAKRGQEKDSEDEEEEVGDIRVVAKPAEVGEGRRRPSWIWFSASNSEDMQDPTMRAGELILYLP